MTSATDDPPDAPTGVFARAVREVDVAGRRPVWQLSDDAVAEAVTELDGLIRLAQAQQLRLVAEASTRGLPGQQGHARLEHWIRAQTPTTSPRVAAAQARRAELLFTSAVAAELEPTREALLAGQVWVEQADVVGRTVAALVPPTVPAGAVPEHAVVEAQAFLLGEARAFDATQLSRLADHLRHRLDPDADDRLAGSEQAQQQARSLTLASTGGGMVHVEGLLSPACGAALRTAIDAWSAPQPASDGTPDARTAAQRRHDGLQRLAEKAVAAQDFLPSTHGSPYRVVVTVSQRDLVEGLGAALPDGTRVSSAAAAALLCEAEIVPVLIDGDANPLDVGRTQRAFTPRQRTALAVRDRRCTWPGCGAPPEWTDAHHLTPWQHGGPSDLDNAALLCSHHHHHVHRAGIGGRVADGEVVWDTVPPGRRPVLTITRALRLLDDLVRRWRLP
ncbi:DUF222 domain-containing protein [Angustibacter sp. McL0619]|uniref:HNH endonuclease signature motif containing protein n=1 Tax=Angustibacter sp. McL0619 TaxID=3415676 RepID=UPI003CF365A8